MTSEHAMFHLAVTPEQFSRSPMVASPMGLFDVAPVCDGAAAVLVCSRDALKPHHKPVRIAGSAIATDTISLGARKRMTYMQASETSAAKAFHMAKLAPKDMDVAEPHDAFTIMTALTLEASGFAKLGTVLDMAKAGAFAFDGDLPICTFGGLKARGHPVGASGTYQIVEACRQLRGDAGKNQVAGAKRAFAQSIGGHGAVSISHILEA
jgi:acetyl-CoA C-acetyltransferase